MSLNKKKEAKTDFSIDAWDKIRSLFYIRRFSGQLKKLFNTSTCITNQLFLYVI